MQLLGTIKRRSAPSCQLSQVSTLPLSTIQSWNAESSAHFFMGTFLTGPICLLFDIGIFCFTFVLFYPFIDLFFEIALKGLQEFPWKMCWDSFREFLSALWQSCRRCLFSGPEPVPTPEQRVETTHLWTRLGRDCEPPLPTPSCPSS